MEKKLNPKQEKFCREYIIDHNATQAAIRSGYSRKTAKQIGQKLLTKVDLQTFLKELESKVAEKLEITTEILSKSLWENHQLAREYGKLGDSNRAIELLGKLHGKFIDRLHTRKEITFEDLLLELEREDKINS